MATPDHVMIRATTSSHAIGELKVKMTSSKNVLCQDGGAASLPLFWVLLIGEDSWRREKKEEEKQKCEEGSHNS